MCERILRNASFDHEGTILRDCQELLGLSSGADPVLFRSLTSGELKLAQTLFKNIINYDRVKIYCDRNHSRYQSKVITNTRNGEILLSVSEYKSDFSADYTNFHDSVKYPHLFIFAMSFVWQYYRHDSSFHDNTYASTRWDSYHLDEPHFIFYSMEQQAAMIADYWLLKKYGLTEYEKLSQYQKHGQVDFSIRKELLDKYQSILWMHIQTM